MSIPVSRIGQIGTLRWRDRELRHQHEIGRQNPRIASLGSTFPAQLALDNVFSET